jgi:hypothetical protein
MKRVPERCERRRVFPRARFLTAVEFTTRTVLKINEKCVVTDKKGKVGIATRGEILGDHPPLEDGDITAAPEYAVLAAAVLR